MAPSINEIDRLRKQVLTLSRKFGGERNHFLTTGPVHTHTAMFNNTQPLITPFYSAKYMQANMVKLSLDRPIATAPNPSLVAVGIYEMDEPIPDHPLSQDGENGVPDFSPQFTLLAASNNTLTAVWGGSTSQRAYFNPPVELYAERVYGVGIVSELDDVLYGTPDLTLTVDIYGAFLCQFNGSFVLPQNVQTVGGGVNARAALAFGLYSPQGARFMP